MRIRLTAATALTMVLAVIAASPATAAPAITLERVKASLLTSADFSAGWHRSPASGSGAPEITGCPAFTAKTVGRKHVADRDFQFRKLPTFVSESVQSFRTRALARQDFVKSRRLFTKCSTFVLDGRPWRVDRVPTPTYADQRVMFRLTGDVVTEAGDVAVTMFLVATRHGRQEVVVLVVVAGNDVTPAIRRELGASSIQISRVAHNKVRDVLGR